MNTHNKTQFKVTDMDCPDCIEKVERAVRMVAGVSDVSASLMAQNVHVTHTGAPREALIQAIQTAGYTVTADTRTVFSVTDMECAACGEKVERAICALDGIVSVTTSVMSQKVTVIYDADAVTANGITYVIRQAGYTPDGELAPTFWHNREKVLTLLSGIFFFAGLLASWFFPETDHAPLWTGHLGPNDALYLIAALIGGCNFFSAGFRALFSFALDMEFLMTAAIVGAALMGEHMEAAAIAFLFSSAELLEDYAVDRARDALKALMKLAPDTATVRRNGQEVTVPVEEVEEGECLIVRPGEKIPVDGKVLIGLSAVDQSPITGESMPVTKQVDDDVFAGAINCEGYLEISAEKRASESTLSRIIALVEEAEEKRAPSENFVRKFSRYYTPAITLLALGVMIIPPLLLDAAFTTWFVRGLTLLVIACPCALVISTPVAVVSGITSAARNGVLIKGGNYLEVLGDVRVVAFDKTGTLTQGNLEVTDVLPLGGNSEEEILRIAAALEQRSLHPIAKAVVCHANGGVLPDVVNFESLTGQGVRGQIDGVVYTVGKPGLFPNRPVEKVDALRRAGKTAVLVGTASQVIGAMAVADTVRPEAKEAIAALHRQGISRVVMLTGDNETTAQMIAEELGVDEWRSELLPEDKVAEIERLKNQYGKVAMVGDGVNDAPALAAASVGIAMGAAGTDTALETADVALLADDLSKLPYLFRLSRSARGVIRQNIIFAIGIKFVLALGVIPGFVTLVMAVLLGDMGTTLGVTGNALRLVRVRSGG
jgi:Cd2+/Zn2+-exporting ATPase